MHDKLLYCDDLDQHNKNFLEILLLLSDIEKEIFVFSYCIKVTNQVKAEQDLRLSNHLLSLFKKTNLTVKFHQLPLNKIFSGDYINLLVENNIDNIFKFIIFILYDKSHLHASMSLLLECLLKFKYYCQEGDFGLAYGEKNFLMDIEFFEKCLTFGGDINDIITTFPKVNSLQTDPFDGLEHFIYYFYKHKKNLSDLKGWLKFFFRHKIGLYTPTALIFNNLPEYSAFLLTITGVDTPQQLAKLEGGAELNKLYKLLIKFDYQNKKTLKIFNHKKL